ncbi:MAG: elongation factor 1-beta [Thermoplasmata archaeon]
MGQVAVLFRMMPSGVTTDMKAMSEAVRLALPPEAKLRGIQVKDIAFGIKALLISIVMADTGGILPATEEALRHVENVASVEVIEEGLI